MNNEMPRLNWLIIKTRVFFAQENNNQEINMRKHINN